MKINVILNNIQENIFDIIIYISYISIILSFFGLFDSPSQYLDKLDYYVRIYICLFLLWRFNPFRKIEVFTNLDRKIVFTAGLFILTTSALNHYVISIKEKALKTVRDVKTKYLSK